MFPKKTKKLRNILQSPFQICWPEKHKEELLPVQNALIELLPAARLEESNVKNNIEKREAKGSSNIKRRPTNEYRNFLALGYQSVIRGIEKKKLCCAVFSNDVTPILLLKIALTCAQTNSIPAIVIPDLKTIASSALGFSTTALGFKTVVAECTNNPFHGLFNIIDENPTVIEFPLTTKPCLSVLEVNGTDEGLTKQELSKTSQINIENVYLFRKPNGKRVFIPNVTTETLTTKLQNPNEFISLGESTQKRSSSQNFKIKSVFKEDDLCDNDDSDSDDGNKFFVDNLPDESLFKTNYVNSHNGNSHKKNLKFKGKKKTKKIKKNMEDLRISGSQFLHTSAHKNYNLVDVNKYCDKKKHKITSSNVVKFQPLSIKTVTCKPNKTKVKNKKRCIVKNSK